MGKKLSPIYLPRGSESFFSEHPVVESVFNGAIHWLAYIHNIGVYAIVAFHLTERKLLVIPLPNDIKIHNKSPGLWIFRGFLSV